MAPLKIEIRGEGETARSPEQAKIIFTISNKGEAQPLIISSVQETASKVQSYLQEFALASDGSDPSIVELISNGMSTRRYDEYKFDQQTGQSTRDRTVFEATVQINATFVHFAKLSACARDLATMEHVTIGEVEWCLTKVTQKRLRNEVIKLAYDDAREQAEAYAAAAGKSTITAIEIKDGAEQNHVYSRRMMAMPAGEGGGEGQETVLEYLPEDVKYSTACIVVFQAE